MKVAVTGGAGFIGHHLVRRLVADGHNVVVLDNLRRGSFERPELRGAQCIEGDIRDRQTCLDAFVGAETVFHLAAQSNVMGSQSDPDYAFSTNVTGTWEVAQAARTCGVRNLVFASSREVYGEPERLPVHEDTPFSPKNAYGASKVAAEVMLAALGREWPGISVARLSNVIGAGDTGRVIPLWLERARAGCPLEAFGGKQVLDLAPVDFVVDSLLSIGTGEPRAEPVNIGSGVGTPILQLARYIVELTDSSSELRVLPPRGPEVTKFVADTTRMRSLGMTPPTDPLAAIEASW
jgi:nucleoside-diphosphate-sugar epimerase